MKLQSLAFDISSDSVFKLELRGGCCVDMNKNLILIEDIIDEDLYQSIINNNNNDYCCIESKIINSPVHGDFLSDLVKYNYVINKSKLITSVINKKYTDIKDYLGLSIGQYKALLCDY